MFLRIILIIKLTVLFAACTGDTTPRNQSPHITSDQTISVSENTESVFYTLIATDPEGDVLTYDIQGNDAHLFNINSVTGELHFLSPPDFETPRDFGNDNRYDIHLSVTDTAGNTDTQPLQISVLDAEDFRVSILSPREKSILDFGENTTIPVVVLFENHNLIPSNIVITANDNILLQSENNSPYWTGDAPLLSGNTTLTVKAFNNNQLAGLTEIELTNKNLPIGEWQLGLDTTRDRLAIVDFEMQDAHFYSLQDANHSVVSFFAPPNEAVFDIEYSSTFDEFFINTFKLFQFDADFNSYSEISLQNVQSHSNINFILPWGITLNDSTNILYMDDLIDGNFIGHIDITNDINTGGFNAPDESNYDSSGGYIDIDPLTNTLYLADRFALQIYAIDPENRTRDIVTTFPWPQTTYAELGDIQFHSGTNSLYVASPDSGSIFLVDPDNGNYQTISGNDIFNSNNGNDPIIGSGPTLDNIFGLEIDTTTNHLYTLSKNALISVDITNGDRDTLLDWSTANDIALHSWTADYAFSPHALDGIQISSRPGEYFTIDYFSNTVVHEKYNSTATLGLDTRARSAIFDDTTTLMLVNHVRYQGTPQYTSEIIDLMTGSRIGDVLLDGYEITGGYHANNTFQVLAHNSDNGLMWHSINTNSLEVSSEAFNLLSGESIHHLIKHNNSLYFLHNNIDSPDILTLSEFDVSTREFIKANDISTYISPENFSYDAKLVSGQANIVYICSSKNEFVEFNADTNEITVHSISKGLTSGYIIHAAKDISGEFYWLHTSEGVTLTYKDGTAIVTTL